jgi:hypothetical protein
MPFGNGRLFYMKDKNHDTENLLPERIIGIANGGDALECLDPARSGQTRSFRVRCGQTFTH